MAIFPEKDNFICIKNLFRQIPFLLNCLNVILELIGWLLVCRSFFSSVHCSVMSDSMQPHGPQHAKPPCLSPTPGACSNSCPSRQWCHPTVSSSVIPFSSCHPSFPTSGSFPISQSVLHIEWPNIGVSASIGILLLLSWHLKRQTSFLKLSNHPLLALNYPALDCSSFFSCHIMASC